MLETLILCMALDYLTGMMAAGIFHKSKKSAQGGLESRSGWKGLCRKGISLLIVLVAYRLDLIAGTDFICNAVMAAYLVNELLSITENLGLMGVPVPKVLSCPAMKKATGSMKSLSESPIYKNRPLPIPPSLSKVPGTHLGGTCSSTKLPHGNIP